MENTSTGLPHTATTDRKLPHTATTAPPLSSTLIGPTTTAPIGQFSSGKRPTNFLKEGLGPRERPDKTGGILLNNSCITDYFTLSSPYATLKPVSGPKLVVPQPVGVHVGWRGRKQGGDSGHVSQEHVGHVCQDQGHVSRRLGAHND